MDDFTRYLPFLFLIALVAYHLWPARRPTLSETYPVQIRRAFVSQKHHEIDCFGVDDSGFGAVSYYRATFEILETREQVTLSLNLDQFAFMDQGVSGNLTSQGTKCLGFEADIPLKNPNEKESPDNEKESPDDEVTTHIKVLCEECWKSCSFPVTKVGTVQQCAHCRAYVDVENQWGQNQPGANSY